MKLAMSSWSYHAALQRGAVDHDGWLKVCAEIGLPLMTCVWTAATPKPPGLIQGRNAFLLLAGLLEAPPTVTALALGVHSGTEYADCTPRFIGSMQSVFDCLRIK